MHFHSNSDTPIYSIFNKVQNNRVKCKKRPKDDNSTTPIQQLAFIPKTVVDNLVSRTSKNIVYDCKVTVMKLKNSQVRNLLLFLYKSIE